MICQVKFSLDLKAGSDKDVEINVDTDFNDKHEIDIHGVAYPVFLLKHIIKDVLVSNFKHFSNTFLKDGITNVMRDGIKGGVMVDKIKKSMYNKK